MIATVTVIARRDATEIVTAVIAATDVGMVMVIDLIAATAETIGQIAMIVETTDQTVVIAEMIDQTAVTVEMIGPTAMIVETTGQTVATAAMIDQIAAIVEMTDQTVVTAAMIGLHIVIATVIQEITAATGEMTPIVRGTIRDVVTGRTGIIATMTATGIRRAAIRDTTPIGLVTDRIIHVTVDIIRITGAILGSISSSGHPDTAATGGHLRRIVSIGPVITPNQPIDREPVVSEYWLRPITMVTSN